MGSGFFALEKPHTVTVSFLHLSAAARCTSPVRWSDWPRLERLPWREGLTESVTSRKTSSTTSSRSCRRGTLCARAFLPRASATVGGPRPPFASPAPLAGLGLAVALINQSPVLLLLQSAVGGCRRGRSALVIGESATPSFGDASRRIKVELGRSGLLCVLDPIVFFFSPSLVFVGVCPVKFLGMLVYRLWRSGWLLDPTDSGGLCHLLDVLCTSVLGSMFLVASNIFYTGEEMVDNHLPRPVRSTSTRHVGFLDVLLLVPLQNFRAISSGRWSATGRLLWPPVTRMTESFLQGFACNFLFFQVCSNLCVI
jgi:hypothetical protein